MKKLSVFRNILCILFVFLNFSCKSYKKIDETEKTTKTTHKIEGQTSTGIEKIRMSFVGDIMAHDSNFMMADYRKIYTDLADVLLCDDLSFGNMEMPICDSLPMSNYPCFNVHSPYFEAAINGGFDVFALANNHSNDQGTKGIDGSLQSIQDLQKKFPDKHVYFSGLKENAADRMHPTLIEKNGFRILYLSVTELLNSHGASKKRLYYSEPTEAGRKKLLETISIMRRENPCDLFILSLHLYEPEYVFTVSQTKKNWFKQLNRAGVDIICASHPHVMQTWEKVSNGTAPLLCDLSGGNFALHSGFFMYSMGNFISGQRMQLNYPSPNHYREYTGDAVLLQLEFCKLNGKVLDDFTLTAFPITVYRSADGFVMRHLTKEFIESLPLERDKNYYRRRLELMYDYLPIFP